MSDLDWPLVVILFGLPALYILFWIALIAVALWFAVDGAQETRQAVRLPVPLHVTVHSGSATSPAHGVAA